MPADTKRTALRGNIFSGPTYLDSVQLFRDRNADVAALGAPVAFITKAAFDALRPGSGRIAQISSGFVEMGPSDDLALYMGGAGANNSTFTLGVWGLYPCVSSTDDSRDTIVGYLQTCISFVAVTLGQLTVASATGQACLGGGTGILTTDLLADTLVPLANFSTNSLLLENNVSDGLASLQLSAPGAVGVLCKTQLGTATQAFVFGRRRQGSAQRSYRTS